MKTFPLLFASFALMLAFASAHAAAPIPKAAPHPGAPPSRNVGMLAPQARFTKAIEDFPVMEGMEVEEGNDVLFVFGTQRIAQTSLVGLVDIDESYYFYEKTLPPLGWKKISPKIYERGNETLHLDINGTKGDGLTHVRVSIEPSR